MNFKIRLIEEEDADFILKLRNNPKLNRYLSPTSISVDDQIKWIINYKKKEKNEKEFYYVIFENGTKKGLYRLYNINNVSFTIGSWLFDVCEDKQLPVITDLLMADIGYYELNKKVLLFDVRKENKKVIQYHALKNPLIYSDDELNNYYLLTKEHWDESKQNVLSFFGISQLMFESFKTNAFL
ncbi:MAG TPA: GNAT family N-acetyltransferase [Paludibacter sp.]